MGSPIKDLVRPARPKSGPPAKRAARSKNLRDRPKKSVRIAFSDRSFRLAIPACVLGLFLVFLVFEIDANYTFSLQSPLHLHWQWPLVVAQRSKTSLAAQAQLDQMGHRLTAYQQYACQKFGPDCRVALAIQRAENPQGKCEIYHYNSDGTLDWGYFQINTVHLKRPGLNLRDLLDCRANIDFAFELYTERNGFTAWSTFNNGLYKRYLRQ